MAFKFIGRHKNDEINRRNRRVEARKEFPLDKFWSQGTWENFFVIGGGQNERNEAVVSYIQTSHRRCLKSVIVFDGTGMLERRLISLYTPRTDKRGRSRVDGYGTLKIYSPTSRGYDIFGGMDSKTVSQFMKEAVINRPLINQINPAYIDAFIDTVTSVTPLTLNALLQLSERSDAEILRIAINTERDQRTISVLRNPDYNGINFRGFLRKLESAFSNIWRRDTVTGNSILRDLELGGIIYINAQSMNPLLFNQYFGTVLNYIGISQNKAFGVVLNDVTIDNYDGLSDHLTYAMRRSNETIGFSYNNIAPLIKVYPDIYYIPRQIVFTGNIYMVPVDLLKSYGTYMHVPNDPNAIAFAAGGAPFGPAIGGAPFGPAIGGAPFGIVKKYRVTLEDLTLDDGKSRTTFSAQLPF